MMNQLLLFFLHHTYRHIMKDLSIWQTLQRFGTIALNYTPRNTTDSICNQVHPHVRKFCLKFLDMACLGILPIVLVQRHRCPVSRGFYLLLSNIASVTDDSSSLSCWSIRWQAFPLPRLRSLWEFPLGRREDCPDL